MDNPHYIYIMTNWNNTILYTGMTSDLFARVDSHKKGLVDGFTKRYNLKKLVYYECAEDLDGALFREKQIKAGSRLKKIELIESMNPGWDDLTATLLD
jgi:putative endonuclease